MRTPAHSTNVILKHAVLRGLHARTVRSMLAQGALLLVACACHCAGLHMSIDTSSSPFVKRADPHVVLQWDTGDVARVLALSQAVVVNYQGPPPPLPSLPLLASLHRRGALTHPHPHRTGIYTVSPGVHVAAPSRSVGKAVRCVETRDALCASTNGSLLVLPNHGDIAVPTDPTLKGLPAMVADFMRTGCGTPRSDAKRTVTHTAQYAVSACDLDAMRYSLLLYRDVLYAIPMPVPVWLHLLLCISCMVTLSLVLYILRPRTEEADSKKTEVPTTHVSPRVLDGGLVNVSVAVLATGVTQAVSTAFVTHEEIAGFTAMCVAFVFYLSTALVTRFYGDREYDKGVVVDACVVGMAAVCTGSYASLQHPFNYVTVWAVLFRMWHKIIRLSFGGGYNPGALFLTLRCFLDSVVLGFMLAYGWAVSFGNAIEAGLWIVPVTVWAYVVAKYIFLQHTHMS